VVLFLIFITVPLAISPFLFVVFESKSQLTYDRAFSFAIQEVTGIDTNSTVVMKTSQSVELVAILGILKFVFIGLGAAILMTQIDIEILKRQRPDAPPTKKKKID